MSTPFYFHGSLHVPPDTGLAPAAIPLVMAAFFSSKAELEMPLDGAGSVDIPLGSLGPAGLKALVLKVDPTTDPNVAPVVVKLGNQAVGVEIAPGGFLAVASPLPKQGIRSMTVTHTTRNVLKVWALG